MTKRPKIIAISIAATALVAISAVYFFLYSAERGMDINAGTIDSIDIASMRADESTDETEELTSELNAETELIPESIAGYPIEFSSSLSEEFRTQIVNDFRLFLSGRNFELDISDVSVIDDAVLNRAGLVPAFDIRFISDENSVGFRSPMALRHLDHSVRQSLVELFARGDSIVFFITQELANVYETQLNLAREYSDAFADLRVFVDRINNLSSEPANNETVNDVFYRSIGKPAVELAQSSYAEIFVSPLINTRYRQVSLLDVIPASTEFESEMIQLLDIPSDALIATLESNQIDEQTRLNGVQILALIYVEARWWVWVPQY